MIAHGQWKHDLIIKTEEWGKHLIAIAKGVGLVEADYA
jgi:hypothetical protein